MSLFGDQHNSLVEPQIEFLADQSASHHILPGEERFDIPFQGRLFGDLAASETTHRRDEEDHDQQREHGRRERSLFVCRYFSHGSFPSFRRSGGKMPILPLFT